MEKLTCPACGSENIGVHENLGGNRKRYKCKDCSKRWNSEAVEKEVLETTDEIDGEFRTVTTKSLNIKTIEQLIAHSKIDMDTWKVKKPTVKTSEVTISGKNTASGKPETYTNYHVSAVFERRTPEFSFEIELENFKRDAIAHAPKYDAPEIIPRHEELMLEASLFDHHWGQLSWGPETGSGNYDIKTARELGHAAVDEIIAESPMDRVTRVVVPVGNDFFNSDSYLNQTMGGTPQAEDGRWKKTFTTGRQFWVSVAERFLGYGVTLVFVIVPGNHGPQREFYLGEVLFAWFHGCSNVVVHNEPIDRKYIQWGKNLIGYTHGHKEVKGYLPHLMATEQPQEWADTRFHEWHKGHLHAASMRAFQVLDEFLGVREWVLPSLVDLDDWHASKGYNHLRQTMAFIWSKSAGQTNIITVTPERLGLT